MRLKNILATIIAVLILVAVGIIPWLDGYYFKQNYLIFLHALSEKTQTKIKLIEYHQGWLGSTAKISIESALLNTMAEGNPANQIVRTNPIILEQVIKHGPFLYDDAKGSWDIAQASIESDVSFSGALKKLFMNRNQQTDMRMNTVISFSGTYDTFFETAPFVFVMVPGIAEVTWQGLKGNVITYLVGSQIKRSQGSIALGEFVAKGSFGSGILRASSYEYDVLIEPIGIWTGKHTMTMPGFSFTDPQGQVSSMEKLVFAMTSTLAANNLWNAEVVLSLQRLALPNIQITPSTITLDYDNFNAKAVANMMQTSVSVGKVAITTGGNYPEMAAFVPPMITASSSISEKINIVSNLGRITSTGKIYWPYGIPLPRSRDEMVANVNFKVDLRASIALINRVIDLLYQNVPQEMPVAAPAPLPPTEAGLIDQIDAWTKSSQIPLDISFQLKDLVGRHLASDIFAKNIDAFVLKKEIPENVATEIKSRYAILYPDPKKGPPPPPVVQPPVVQAPVSQATVMKNTLADWVKKGYIIVDKDEYVTTITREQGVIKVNGL